MDYSTPVTMLLWIRVAIEAWLRMLGSDDSWFLVHLVYLFVRYLDPVIANRIELVGWNYLSESWCILCIIVVSFI